MSTVETNNAKETRRIGTSVAAYPDTSTSAWSRQPGLDWIPPTALSVLLIVATWYDGAFALRHWAPVALLALLATVANQP